MQAADMVYYLYTDKHGVPLKLPAVVIGVDDNGIAIRVGRYDVHSKEVSTIESVVAAESLQPRSVPCSYEDDLRTPV